jgi:hypothetical protein
MTARRSLPIGVALGLGVAVILAGPIALLWSEFRPQPWDLRTLRVHFESARYETAALIFTYRIENRAHYALRLLPEVTRVIVRQTPGRPTPGYPSVDLPFDLPSHTSQLIEIRLDLPLRDSRSQMSDEQSKRILQFETPAQTPNLTPIPAANLPPVASQSSSPDTILDSALVDLDGFDLINESKRVHIVLPRGW